MAVNCVAWKPKYFQVKDFTCLQVASLFMSIYSRNKKSIKRSCSFVTDDVNVFA